MKRIILFITFFIASITAHSQNLSLNEIFALCNKSNWDEVNEYMLKKGWEYHESSKGDDTHYNTITWSYNKEYYGDKAQGWFYLYTYEGYPNKISYSFFNKTSYNTIKSGITAAGLKLVDNSIEDNEIVTKYAGLSFIVTVKTAKREKEESYYSDNSITAYSVVVIKKAGVYDNDNGLKKTYDSYGNIETEYTLKDSKLNGTAKSYYTNGQLKVVSNFINGTKQGASKEYAENGSLTAEYNYLNGEPSGTYKIYEKGKLELIGNLLNGKKNGQFKVYDEDGKLDKEYVMKDDSIISFSGIEKTYDTYGNLESEYTLKDSKINGTAKVYYSNGQIKVISNFINGKKQGASKEYAEDGSLTAEYNYLNGEPNGEYKIYENKKLKITGVLLNGKKNGQFKVYDEDGNLDKEYVMKDDALNGNYIEYYYKDNKLILKNSGQYLNDVKSGLWQVVKFKEKETDILSTHNYLNGEYDGAFKEVSSDSIIYGSYQNGILNGKYKIYTSLWSYLSGNITGDTTGAILTTNGNYYNGKKSGYWKYYSLTKVLRREGSYSDDEKTGEWKYYYDNMLKADTKDENEPYSKQLYLVENYENGKLNGKSVQTSSLETIPILCDTSKYKNKSPLDTCYTSKYEKFYQVAYYKNGELHGPLEYKDSAGVIRYKGTFINGLKDGLWVESYESNNTEGEQYYIYDRGNYSNGKKTGAWDEYVKDDFVFTKYNYVNGKLDGKTVDYNSQHKPREEKYFENGKLKTLITYDSLGTSIKVKYEILTETNYDLTCRRTEYEKTGKVSQVYWMKKQEEELNFNFFELLFLIAIDGKLSDGSTGYANGELKVYGSDDKILVEGSNYKKDRTGKWKFYYYDVNIYTEQEYSNNVSGVEKYFVLNTGQPFSGKFIQKYDNEKVKYEFKISDGLRDGKSKYYDENGKIIKTEKYDKGIIKI